MTQAAVQLSAAAGARLVLRDLVARDASGPKGAARGVLYGVSLDLGDTDAAILGGIEDGTLALALALIGRRAPDRGSVRVDGKAPFSAPEARRAIASFGVEPALPLAPTVAHSLAIATSSWERPRSADEVLSPWSLARLAARAVTSLTAAELRALEIALAFAVPSPSLVVAFEPFSDTTLIPRGRIEEELSARARRCPVLALTSRPADARRFGRVIVLHRGAFVRSTSDAHAALAPAVPTFLTAWCSAGARELAAALAKDPSVSNVALDLTGEGAGIVRVTGAEAEPLALAIADACRASAATVSAVSEGAPGLAEIRAASELEIRSHQLAAQHRHALEARAQQQQAQLYQQSMQAGGHAPKGYAHGGQVPFGAAAPFPAAGAAPVAAQPAAGAALPAAPLAAPPPSAAPPPPVAEPAPAGAASSSPPADPPKEGT